MNDVASTKIVLDKIANDIQVDITRNDENSFISLSCLTFFVQYSQFTGQDFSLLIRDGIEKLYTTRNLGNTFWDGKAGLFSFYTFLKNKGILTSSDFQFLIANDTQLQEYSIAELKKGNSDFLYGAIGIAYYYLYNYVEKNQAYLGQFFNELRSLLNKSSGMFEVYDFDSENTKTGEIHISIPHGILGILKLCIECYRKGICRDVSSFLIQKISDYLYSHRVNSSSYTFTNVIHNANALGSSRLAWCYGDLGAGIILYQCGCCLEDSRIKMFGIEILEKCTLIRNETAAIYDASICHGSSGAAYIFGKMFHYSKSQIFRNAQEYWINQTLNYASSSDGVGGYKSYNITSDSYDDRTDILNGVSGIGLSLLSYLNNDFSWDYAIMLND